ncbi:hypothetical protein OsccyDRAFT_0733 [Leptolyngbyaceae cyanobacterium JSC-12]|nr:hypothetical protein OsccyDRAFT_0733 [Leptolyngbyaceae cyanobacterium JSC-12]
MFELTQSKPIFAEPKLSLETLEESVFGVCHSLKDLWFHKDYAFSYLLIQVIKFPRTTLIAEANSNYAHVQFQLKKWCGKRAKPIQKLTNID